ncbi:hypothetical protein ACFXDD_22230 [Streptomyces anthocyanicus]|uniref:hypothetical protein n=1 Tax=Streptomyces anthocyanicus TaxID=68174 RepID=UPI003639A96B
MTPPPPHELAVTVRVFTQRFSSTPLGARLARHLAAHQLHVWGIPHGSSLSDTRADRRPPARGEARGPAPLDERGRGLLLVGALADRWEVVDRVGHGVALPGKTIHAELDLTPT